MENTFAQWHTKKREASKLRRARTRRHIDEETRRILEHYDEAHFDDLSLMLDRQFSTLHQRAHVLLLICSVLVTGSAFTTFQLSRESSALIFVVVLRLFAGALAIAAAALTLMGVLRIEWITRYPGETREAWLRYALCYRDHKTAIYRAACWMTLTSMLLYECSVVAILLA